MKKNLLLFLISFNFCNAHHYKLTARIERPGFFSEFHTVLGVLDAYENSDEISGIEVDLTYGTFFDPEYNPNYWENYFEPIRVEKKPRGQFEDQKKFTTYYKTSICSYMQYGISRERSYELIQRYIKPKPHIQEKVNSFCATHFKDNYIIGVHFRGTDKYTEAKPCSYKEVCDAIKPQLIKHPDAKIFIATDELGFLMYAQMRYPGKVVSIRMQRSTNKNALHHSRSDNKYLIGENSVLDCLLLSRCSVLFKMASNLSDASAKFNPNIPVINLNENYFLHKKRTKYNEIQCLNYALYLADLYEKNGEEFTIHFPTSGSRYPNRRDNWWEYHFEPFSVGNNPQKTALLVGLTGYYAGYALYEMPKQRAHYLLKKYIHLKKEILEKIDSFAKKEFDGYFVQGVFYQNRTGSIYQPSIPHEHFINYLKKNRSFLPEKNKIFVCTNDPIFLQKLQSTFDNVVAVNSLSNHAVPKKQLAAKASFFSRFRRKPAQRIINKAAKIPDYSQQEIEEINLINIALLAQTNEIIGTGSPTLEVVAQFNPNLTIRTFDSSVSTRTE